ncbi:MAG TPA: response regulator, partial [Rhodospirillaceae bacterium]|nr:response regulator [Rhodospirillaceae bacterium]
VLALSSAVVCLLILRLLGHLARHRADQVQLLRLSRLMRTQSAGNQAVVRAADEQQLFQRICDVAVDSGGFRMAWIGLAESDAERTVKPVALAGHEDGYLAVVSISWGDNAAGQGISGMAIRSGEPQVNHDFDGDPRMAPWRAEAARRGFRSSIALPLTVDGGCLGALTIYSGEAGAFGAEEVRLLADLAEDVSFGVAALRARRRHREVEQALVQLQKLDALGQLTGGIAHDFNNLLQVILSNLDLAIRAMGPGAAGAEFLANAVGGAQQGAKLTGQLLAFARLQPLNPCPLACDRLLGEMASMLRRTIGEQIAIELAVDGGLWPALADSSQLQNAILNLALNARDAMPAGGKLTIGLSNRVLDAAYAAEHLAARPGEYVMLAVTDTGSGMAPEVLDQALQPFFTTKREGAGTGLGLSMVYGFVRQSGGHIQIDSLRGRGTTVRLYLPRSLEPETVAPEAAEERPIAQGRGEVILVAEDDDVVRAATVAQLTALGYQAIGAENGETALKIVESGQRIDLLFTDIVMTGEPNGRVLADRARAFEPGLPVLFTSGYSDDAASPGGLADDSVVLLSKPYRLAQLAESVKAALAGRAGPAAPGSPAGLLLVEDEEIVRTIMSENLENAGFQVRAVGRPGEALRLLEENPAIKVLITDYGLPDMDGLSLAARALALSPGLSVIVASGRFIDPAELPDPAIVLLPKPFKLAQLFAAIDRVTEPA